jgi:hypothetical protein
LYRLRAAACQSSLRHDPSMILDDVVTAGKDRLEWHRPEVFLS